jgi:Recombination endonuclease VII
MAKHKKCPGCETRKAASEFGRNVRTSDGLAYYCKECFGAISKASYRRRRALLGRTVAERRGPAPEGMKWCNDCQEYRPTADFPRNKRSKDGFMVYCKPHHNARGRESRERRGGQRAYHLKGRYGISLDDLNALIDRQGSKCAICLRPIDDKSHVDHDHRTGVVRGALCFNCNGGLGQFRDDTAALLRAVEYLRDGLAS